MKKYFRGWSRIIECSKQIPSEGELLLREFILNKYPINNKIYCNIRPDWLINPETGRRMELDIYLPKNNIAFEFQGFQHKTKYQSKKDGMKYAICKKNKIFLYEIWSGDLPTLHLVLKSTPPKSLRKKLRKYALKFGCPKKEEFLERWKKSPFHKESRKEGEEACIFVEKRIKKPYSEQQFSKWKQKYKVWLANGCIGIKPKI